MWLTSSIGQEVINKASTFIETLTASTKLRTLYPDLSPELIRQAITQSTLRSKAASEIPEHFLFTEEGLQQATRPAVAKFRANFIQEAFGSQKIVDLTCGLGLDSYFLASLGHSLTAIEIDPVVAQIANYNLSPLGIEVINTDATEFQVPQDTDLVFIDPARRDPNGPRPISGQAKRITNPNNWSPSLDFVKELSNKYKVVAKVAPGISNETIGNWDAYWISHEGDLVETMLVWPGESRRFAVLLNKSTTSIIEGGSTTKTGDLGQYLIVPNPALIRASALDFLANKFNAGLVNEHIAWLTCKDNPIESIDQNVAQYFEIKSVQKLNEKELVKVIATQNAGSLTIMSRGVDLDPEVLRKKLLRHPVKAGPELVVAIYREDAGTVALVCTRLTKRL